MLFRLKNHNPNIFKSVIICLIAIISYSCSPEQKGILSKGYHNTTARFNAYFYAKQGITEVEEKIRTSKKDDYNTFLPIYIELDSTLSKSLEENLNDVIKKSSIAIQRHPNSDWSDDSYLLVAKSRYYLLDFKNAVETFKYVNVNSKDSDVKHAALINLLRTYITLDEPYNVVAVNDILKKVKLSEQNMLSYHLILAHLFQLKEDNEGLIKNLEIAASLSKKKDHRDRLFFILGQYLQADNRFPEAYSAYRQTLRSNPSYELSFHTKLNMGQVTEISEDKKLKEIRKYFKKLLKDKKNEDYHDKIFYEIGKFEERQEHYPKAIEDYTKSTRKADKNPLQKAYSFLKIAKIYHDIYKDLNQAKNYYDSLMTYLPKDHEEYLSLKEQQEILTAFTTEMNIIKEQDSLLRVSEMDTTFIIAKIDSILMAENEAKRIAEKKRKKADRFQTIESFESNLSNNTAFETKSFTGTTSTGEWYFYDLGTVANGKNKFKNNWGNRPLVDHWNRKSANWQLDLETKEDTETEIQELKAKSKNKENPIEVNKARFDAYYSKIPFTKEAKAIAIKKLEGAHFNLGNIYLRDMMDTTNSIQTFEHLTWTYKEAEKRPETLYQLYLLYKIQNNPKLEQVKNELLTVYPESLYAKLILNPNFRLEDDQKNEQLKLAYQLAYQWYELDSLKQSRHILDSALNVNPGLPFSDNLRILNILMIGKTEGLFPYQLALQNFLKTHTESPMKEYAEKLLASSNEYKKEVDRAKGIRFIPDFEVEHRIAIVYPNVPELSHSIPEFIKLFIQENNSEKTFDTGQVSYENDKTVFLLDSFKNKKEVMAFYTQLMQGNNPINKNQRYDIFVFPINKDNFQILYDQKAVTEYESFFKQNYLNK